MFARRNELSARCGVQEQAPVSGSMAFPIVQTVPRAQIGPENQIREPKKEPENPTSRSPTKTNRWECRTAQENGGRYRDRTYGPYHVKV